MDREHMTIMLVTPGSKGSRAFSIKMSYLKTAFIIAILFSAISAFSFVCTYTFYHKSEAKSESVSKLLTTISILNKDINENKTTETILRAKLSDIEKSLLEMQDLLEKKGIKKQLAVGGEFIDAEKLTAPYVDYMKNDIDDLFLTMKNLPLGTPLDGKLNSGFGYRKDPFKKKGSFHPGLDIDAKYGDDIVVTADGVVEKAGWYHSYGKTVIVKHEGNFETLYGHLSSIEVKEGQKVKTGDIIGKAGSTGRSTGTHLHYEIVRDGKRINPIDFLSLK